MPQFEFNTIQSKNSTVVQMFVDGEFYYHHEVRSGSPMHGDMLRLYEQSAEAFLKYRYYAEMALKDRLHTA